MNEVNIFKEIYELDALGDGIESLYGCLGQVHHCLSGGEIYDLSALRGDVEFLLLWNLSNGINTTLEEMLEAIDSM